MQYSLIYSKRKTLGFSIDSEGQLIVKAPYGLESRKIESMIQSHLPAIQKLKDRVYHDNTPKMFFNGGGMLPYKGHLYPMIVKLAHAGPRLELEGEKLIFYTKYCTKQEQVDDLRRYFKSETSMYIEQVLPLYAKKIGVSYNQVFIKNQKTRWGSCSSKRNLNFNLRLAMMPNKVVDYILIHELCHLLEMNHSKAFWQLVSIHCPDYETCRKWLKENARYFI